MRIKTLKNKIILYFLIITIVPTISLTFFYYKNTNEVYEKHMLEDAFDDIYYIKRSIDEKISMAVSFMDWFYMNTIFDDILTQDYSMSELRYDRKHINSYNQMKLQLINSSLGKYISSLIVVGDNRVTFRYGNDASMIKIDEIMLEDWFEAGMSRDGLLYWPGITENPATIRSSNYIIPIVRPIYHTTLNKKIGWVFIAFREELFSDIYVNSEEIDIHKYFIIDQNGKAIPYDFNEELLTKGEMYKRIYNILDREEDYYRFDENGEEYLYVYENLNNNWVLLEVLSLAGLNQQKKVLTNFTFIILLSSLVFTSLLTIYLSFNLTDPLKKIILHVNRISTGFFEQSREIEGQDEMGILGRKINEMAGNIKGLMSKLLEEEKEKRELELKALQNQINPHFLYNTLNSIKWMATVQQADGIKNIVVALGRLLKNLSTNTTEEITLKEEISLLEDYIFIQQVRYKGKIKFNIEVEDEILLKTKILKFTLQPIVENSIFHGIEAKKNAGNIDLFICRDSESNDIIIKIKDDGIGMPKNKIKEVFTDDHSRNHRGLNGIGLINVYNRIKLTYGESYGLEIKSIPEEYTMVIIRIPYQIDEL